jgi:hypothetical protein
MEFKKSDLLVEDNSEEGIFKKVMSKLKDVKDRAQSEIKETRALVRILTHAVKSYAKDREFDLNKEDKDFIKGQSADVIRTLVLTIVAIIPIPIPLTPFLIIFGKKIGIDLTPKEQVIPDKGKPKKDKIEESKKLNIIISEEQYNILNEVVKPKNIILSLCKRQKERNIYCDLYDFYLTLDPENTQPTLEATIEELNDYFKYKKVGMFPILVKLALQDKEKTVSYLKLISEFIDRKQFDKTETKRIINKQRNRTDISVKDVEQLAKDARRLEHQKYEERFHGDYFKKKSTFLRLNYSCDDDVKESLFNILTRVGSKERTIDEVFEQVKRCILQTFDKGIYYVKADLESTSNFVCSGETIFNAGSNFEVKKMDPFVDSYLSEFLSIFKETEKIQFKGEYIGIYNELIQRLYEWLISSEEANAYIEKVKSQITGIIYENDIVVPIQYIDLYWSNKGQRGCDEKRLSIRFKIKNDVGSEIQTYKFINSAELEPVIKKIPINQTEKIVCP